MVVAEQVSLPFSTILVTTEANSKPHNSMKFYSHQDVNTSSPMQFTISQFAERSNCSTASSSQPTANCSSSP